MVANGREGHPLRRFVEICSGYRKRPCLTETEATHRVSQRCDV